VKTAHTDQQILESWHRNAAPWTAAVREGRIESRRLVTDDAAIEAVMSTAPRSVLDIGCGEGWLARALAARGVVVTGVDAVPELIAQASAAGGGDFRTMSYEQLAAGALSMRVDSAVCNFSLIGKQSVEALFAALPALLNPRGTLVVQTLHPREACGDAPYADGWRDGSWAGFDGGFRDAAPWYFRTLESWEGLFRSHGFDQLHRREPLHPATGRPASVIFIAHCAGQALRD
jgi:2-polyprenyl-3-methyl-5-hydroxy-6-metoxy-1,4-benzoquinol methylase